MLQKNTTHLKCDMNFFFLPPILFMCMCVCVNNIQSKEKKVLTNKKYIFSGKIKYSIGIN